jgi:2-oxoglutarate dehydrogenase E2 component (dihydrolipoamide succinyltransferase)
MALFVKACVGALKEFPSVNAEIDGADVIFKNHYDIAIAVASPQGLVVPVVRDCDSAHGGGDRGGDRRPRPPRPRRQARHRGPAGRHLHHHQRRRLRLADVDADPQPPQSGILGMHKVMQRPMVMDDGAIQARPMMYVALTYDHRIIDGREAVSFLVRVKECVEDPQRLLVVRIDPATPDSGETLFGRLGRHLLDLKRRGLVATLAPLDPSRGAGFNLTLPAGREAPEPKEDPAAG